MVENQTVVVVIVGSEEGIVGSVEGIVGSVEGIVGSEEGIVGSEEGIVGFGESPVAVTYLEAYFADFGYLVQFVALYQLEYFQ